MFSVEIIEHGSSEIILYVCIAYCIFHANFLYSDVGYGIGYIKNPKYVVLILWLPSKILNLQITVTLANKMQVLFSHHRFGLFISPNLYLFLNSLPL